VYYDGDCRFCVAGQRRWGRLFARRGYAWVPLQAPGTAVRLGVSEGQLLTAMWLQFADGRTRSGVDAWAALFRSVWWLWPLGALLAMPGLRRVGGACYRVIARNRHCLGGACAIHTHDEHHRHAAFLELP
jgi:predicted DCC family thiol-disulfide oxidoreductase YuxK